jgi:hypothetical protein
MIVFSQTSHWEKKEPQLDPQELAEERREIKSIFKAILGFACRVVATSHVFPSDVQPKHLCSPKQR